MAYGEVGQAEFIRDSSGAITGMRFQGRTWSPGTVATGGVIEAANLAAFPATGDSAFLYAALDTLKLYVWTGSNYVEASGLPGSSDAVAEGSTNLYYTTARAALKADSASPNFTGPMTSSGVSVLTPNAMGGGLAIDVTKGLNTKTIAADSVFTFSGTPATNAWFSLHVTNSDTNAHTLTIPSSFSVAQQAAITTVTIPASGQLVLTWRYDGSAYALIGDATSGDLAEITLASASTVNIFAAASNNIAISGTTAVTAFDATPVGVLRTVRATGAFVLTHNATSLILPGGASITTVAGDTFLVRSEGSGNARVLWYSPVTVTGTGSQVRATAPTLSNPVVGTQSFGDNSTKAASTAFVQAAIAGTSRVSFGDTGAFANFPQAGAAGTNTTGVHSGAFSVLDSSTAAAATTNLSTIGWKRRQQYTAAAAANNRGAGIRSSTTGVAWVPNTGNTEALRFEAFFGSADALTGCRGAVGLGWFAGSTPSMTAEPSTFTNCLMVYYDSTDSTLKIGINDGSGSLTPVATSASFPSNGNETDFYRILFKMYGGTRSVDWTLINLVSGATLSGNVASDLPAADQQLMAFAYRNSAGSGGQAIFNYGGMYGGPYTSLS